MGKYCLVVPANIEEPYFNYLLNCQLKKVEPEVKIKINNGGYIELGGKRDRNVTWRYEYLTIPMICEYKEIKLTETRKVGEVMPEVHSEYILYTDMITGKRFWSGKEVGSIPEKRIILKKVFDITASDADAILGELYPEERIEYTRNLKNLEKGWQIAYQEFMNRLEEIAKWEELYETKLNEQYRIARVRRKSGK